MKSGLRQSMPDGPVLVIVAIALSAAAVSAQVQQLGLRFLRVQQEKVHQEMLAGVAGNPWQYRILADLMVEPLIQIARRTGLPSPTATAFIAFRGAQCLLILLLAGTLYRMLGLHLPANVLGLSILTWGISLALYNSDLSFNVFFDVAFYLLAGILVLERRYLWVAVLMLPASANRETSILIPAMLAAHGHFVRAPGTNARGAWWAAAAGTAVYAAVSILLRFQYGHQEFLTADGLYPGLGLLRMNLTRLVTWQQLLITFGIVPLLALAAYTQWPRSLRIFFWVVVPAWVVVHFTAALVAESRLLLVPQALIWIPGALIAITPRTVSLDPQQAGTATTHPDSLAGAGQSGNSDLRGT